MVSFQERSEVEVLKMQVYREPRLLRRDGDARGSRRPDSLQWFSYRCAMGQLGAQG
jgi:hypothetical protein